MLKIKLNSLDIIKIILNKNILKNKLIILNQTKKIILFYTVNLQEQELQLKWQRDIHLNLLYLKHHLLLFLIWLKKDIKFILQDFQYQTNLIIFQKLIKELGVGLLNGIICSVIILGAAFGLGYSMELSMTVSISLLAVIIFAALFGTFIPLTLEKYKIDPALATGPFITTINDVLGLFIYFWIGQMIL